MYIHTHYTAPSTPDVSEKKCPSGINETCSRHPNETSWLPNCCCSKREKKRLAIYFTSFSWNAHTTEDALYSMKLIYYIYYMKCSFLYKLYTIYLGSHSGTHTHTDTYTHIHVYTCVKYDDEISILQRYSRLKK